MSIAAWPKAEAGRGWPWWVIAGAWLLACAAGLAFVWHHQYTPAPQPGQSTSWPAGSEIAPDSSRPTLLMFVHPRCPCTRASLLELERAVDRSGRETNVHVIFFQPQSAGQDWGHGDLWARATTIPGAQVRSDLDGHEARRFEAKTSGQVLLFDARGQLLFRGGITPSRGHGGKNAGADALVACLASGHSDPNSHPVFGCPLASDLDSGSP